MPARNKNKIYSGVRHPARSIKAVLRARVSTPGQEKDGYSLPAQKRFLREYAAAHSITIAEEFVDAESSRIGDGDGFLRMVKYLRKHPECTVILVEKTDRLYRNQKDLVTIDELGVEIHFVKEGMIFSKDSPSSEKFMHGLKVLMAKNFSDNLSEETLKGMTQKARAGIYPSSAAVGYKNVDKIVVPDSDSGPVISLAYERFETGDYSIKELAGKFNEEGLKLRGRRFYSSTLHQILRRRLYSGDFDFNGITYAGTHEPLVPRGRWQRVQDLLDARAQKKTRRVKHNFAFTGVVVCGHCGCLMVGELKKGKYIYYHCTGNRGKCPEPLYTREEKLVDEFANVLRLLVTPQPILDWLRGEVLVSDRAERAERQHTIQRWQVKHDQIERRIEAMYEDKLDGRITQDLFDKRAADCRRDQKSIRSKIREIERAPSVPVDEAIDMMGIMSGASEEFLKQPPAERRRLLQVVVQNASWKDGKLQTTLFEPFEILRHSNQQSSRKEKEKAGSGSDLDIWLLG